MTGAQDLSFPLEPDVEAVRGLVEGALERLLPFLASLPEQDATSTDDGVALARSLVESAPEEGAGYDDLLDVVFERAVPNSFNTASPGYLAFIPGGGLPHTAVATLIADLTNRYVTVFSAAPGMVQLEANVVRWFCEFAGLPEGSGGTLTTGGSMANWIALVTARRERLPEDFLKGTLYTSDQVHHSVTKAAVLAGFPQDAVRVIPSDDAFRLRVDALEAAIAADRAAGRTPFLIVGSAGTTNCGAVDPLDALADVAEREGLWLHLDGAYGGFFCLTERGRDALRGLERADSITLDPHKSLFLPYGYGSLLVRDPEALRRANSVTSDYMPAYQEDPDLVDFCAISPELSRSNRGLGLWLPLKLCGVRAFRDALDEKLDLARQATEVLRAMEHVRIVAEPVLSVVAFRLEPDGVEGEALDALNRAWIEAVNRRQRVMLTGTVLRGRFALRICVLSFRTHAERLEQGLEDLAAAAGEVLRRS